MILIDINLLLYAYNKSAKQHERAGAWLSVTLNGNDKVCFSWHTILGFIRISTTPQIFPNHYTAGEAIKIASDLMSLTNSIMISPGDRHFTIFRKLVEDAGISGPRISDAHIAALAIEHGAALASSDRDFRVFDGLKLINPLIESN